MKPTADALRKHDPDGDQDEDPDDGYSWLKDMKESELLEVLSRHEHNAYLAYKHGGYDMLVLMWEKFSSVYLYFSKKSLRELQVRYIRQNCDPSGADPDNSIAAMAIRLRVSDIFVRGALAGDGSVPDNRQLDLLGRGDGANG